MIGPGWMPSQPRPLARMRRGLDWYTARSARRRPRRTRSERSARPHDPAHGSAPDYGFDGAPAALPMATVRTSGSQGLAVDLLRWLGERWRWLRPRSIPLVVAGAAMVLMLGAVNRLTAYAPPIDTRPRAGSTMADSAPADAARVQLARHRAPVQVRSIPAEVIYVGYVTAGAPSTSALGSASASAAAAASAAP